ncbi:HNH endonuclease [Kitasatospora sp. NPDC053057]|uniref:HNH endonuclease n=1 Tax=Kitasatospora sp. NPDC053057 TaxID=3364062 RepID=UPI0037C7BA79
MYPRGRHKGDLSITVDHVLPVSAGGTGDLDNLRLCCSWCNRSKSNILDLYAATDYGCQYEHPEFGWLSLPNYGWSARVLALAGSCSHCGATQKDDQLFLSAPPNIHRINPTCLQVFCGEHDPWSDNRMVPALSLPK